MPNISEWNEIHGHLEQLLPNGLDTAMWEILQQQPLSFVADELLWRVEAIARHVPAQGPLFLESLARTDQQRTESCAFCAQ